VGIIIKSEREIAIMRQAGRIVAIILDILTDKIRPGMKTRELDVIAAREVAARGAVSSFKGYMGYPASLCVSINDEIVHGIPGERIIKEGDLVKLDFGVIYQGYQGDAAVTVAVGEVSPLARKLMGATKGALYAGIMSARDGARLGDIGAAVEAYAKSYGFSVVREYTGHGIGRAMHEEPQIPNFGEPGQGPLLKKGMTLALEPMVNTGDWRAQVGVDGWVVHTADGSLSAHYEHTIAITEGEPEILTVK
jgi:methionyl aminopeptidase